MRICAACSVGLKTVKGRCIIGHQNPNTRRLAMYRYVEENPRMTANEASAMYPNDFILIRCDERVLSNPTGTVLYIGNDYGELFRIGRGLENPSQCIVFEGLNHQRSMGGVVVGG